MAQRISLKALVTASLLSVLAHAAQAAEEEVVIRVVWDSGGRFEQELAMPADSLDEACTCARSARASA